MKYKNNSMTIRFDESSFMQIKEIAKAMKCNYSVVIRALVKNSIEQMIDDNGNIRYGAKAKELESKLRGNADDS